MIEQGDRAPALSITTSDGAEVDLAALARVHFDHVEAVESPIAALARGHELGEPEEPILDPFLPGEATDVLEPFNALRVRYRLRPIRGNEPA